MGNVIAAAANDVTENVEVPVTITVPVPENTSVQPLMQNWAFARIRDGQTGLYRIELDKLAKLVSTNLIRTKDLGHHACKAILRINLDTTVPNFPIPGSMFPVDPIWYGPYDTVNKYIGNPTLTPGQIGLENDTFLDYPFNKSETVHYYFVRFTNEANVLNIDLIRQMYHCLELKWAIEGLITDEPQYQGKLIRFRSFDGKQINLPIGSLREAFGYYNLMRKSYYELDRFIITQFMELIGLMGFPPQEVIVGYYFNNDIFHEEFTISAGLQRSVLKKPKISIAKRTAKGLLWEMVAGGVNLAQTSNLLQIEPNLSDKQKLLEIEQPLQIEANLSDKQKLLEIEQPLQIESSTDLSFSGITNSDEFIKIIQEFFNYLYEVLLFDMSDLKLNNIRLKQLELTEKALLLITNKKLYNFTKNYLYLYTISPVEKISTVENIGGKRNKYKSKSKRKRNKRKNKNKSKKNQK
jgi:hypothetical protein